MSRVWSVKYIENGDSDGYILCAVTWRNIRDREKILKHLYWICFDVSLFARRYMITLWADCSQRDCVPAFQWPIIFIRSKCDTAMMTTSPSILINPNLPYSLTLAAIYRFSYPTLQILRTPAPCKRLPLEHGEPGAAQDAVRRLPRGHDPTSHTGGRGREGVWRCFGPVVR